MSPESQKPAEPSDPIHLFIRTDERTEQVEAKMHDIALDVENVKGDLAKMEGRVNLGVAVTGQRNSTDIGEMKIHIAGLQKDVDRLDQQINNRESGLIVQFREFKEAIGEIRRAMIGVVFGGVVLGLVVYAAKFFK